jgi:hypothetical protein
MLSEYNREWVVDQPYDNVCETILRLWVCRLLLTKVDQHALDLIGL